jgi:hypothetical protein
MSDAAEELQQLISDLYRVQRQLAHGPGDVDIESLGHTLGRLIGQLEQVAPMTGATATVHRQFEQLRLLASSFEEVDRRWTDIRRRVGEQAAHERLKSLDVSGGWQRRWGELGDFAWSEREERWRAGSAREDSLASTSPSPWGRGRFGPESLRLMLDLRYAADLPLAEIASYFSVSPAFAQMRIAEFEQFVAERFARMEIEREVPDGWTLTENRGSRLGADVELIRDDSKTPKDRIGVDFLVIWDEKRQSGGGGRSRSASRHARRRAVTQQPLIFAMVFPERALVRYATSYPYADKDGLYAELLAVDPLTDERSEVGYSSLGEAIDELRQVQAIS